MFHPICFIACLFIFITTGNAYIHLDEFGKQSKHGFVGVKIICTTYLDITKRVGMKKKKKRNRIRHCLHKEAFGEYILLQRQTTGWVKASFMKYDIFDNTN